MGREPASASVDAVRSHSGWSSSEPTASRSKWTPAASQSRSPPDSSRRNIAGGCRITHPPATCFWLQKLLFTFTCLPAGRCSRDSLSRSQNFFRQLILRNQNHFAFGFWILSQRRTRVTIIFLKYKQEPRVKMRRIQ